MITLHEHGRLNKTDIGGFKDLNLWTIWILSGGLNAGKDGKKATKLSLL